MWSIWVVGHIIGCRWTDQLPEPIIVTFSFPMTSELLKERKVGVIERRAAECALSGRTERAALNEWDNKDVMGMLFPVLLGYLSKSSNASNGKDVTKRGSF